MATARKAYCCAGVVARSYQVPAPSRQVPVPRGSRSFDNPDHPHCAMASVHIGVHWATGNPRPPGWLSKERVGITSAQLSRIQERMRSCESLELFRCAKCHLNACPLTPIHSRLEKVQQSTRGSSQNVGVYPTKTLTTTGTPTPTRTPTGTAVG